MFFAKNPQGLTVVISFWDGDNENKQYRRAFDRYLAKPTRTLPPTPRDFPMVSMRVIEPGKLTLFEGVAYPPGSFQGSIEHPGISVGSSSVEWTDAGQTVRILCDLPPLGAHLTFRASSAVQPVWETLLTHRHGVDFTLSGIPACEVTGSIRTADKASVNFSGTGVRGQFFGTAPMAEGVRKAHF